MGNYTDILRLLENAPDNEILILANKIVNKKGRKEGVKFLNSIREMRPTSLDPVMTSLNIINPTALAIDLMPNDQLDQILIAWSA
jgi:hypothetical protein